MLNHQLTSRHERLLQTNKMIGFKKLFALIVLWQTAYACRVAYNTDYLGCDIGHSFENTWEECAKACNRFHGCTHWTWSKTTSPHVPKKCHYKNSKCNVKQGDVRLISGDKACARPIPPQACNVDHDIDYPGCDIGHSYQNTWRACAEACERTSGCEFWTWAKTTSNIVPKKCHYKNSKCGKVKSDNRLVSGNKACGTPCQVDYLVDYLGCDIGSSYEESWQDCAKKCDVTKDCQYWTYVHRLSGYVPKKCHFKNKKCNYKTGRNYLISGNRACAQAPYVY